jgi:hypothetical protein
VAHTYRTPATQEAEIRRITILSQPWANSSPDTILKKTHHKKVLVEWLKVKALSSNPTTEKKKKTKK